MGINLAHKWGTGLAPEQFIAGMTKNKEAFLDWYERFVWENGEDRQFFASLRHRDDIRCLILAADWCGDVVRNVPVLFRALAEAEIPTEVLIMEEHLDVMDQFLTMGGRAIPIAIFTDTGGHVLAKWGPRPAYIQAVMVAFKQANPDRNAPDYEEKIKAAREEVRQKYGQNTDYQQAIVKELREVLSAI
ncbi:thioredoxin family protein [Brevibacillus sp. SYP-B805]|uniref:thioredoxin family protein n=1 Tax=Brevibacillus sp. SYP-B805 TaxID=1578199 RepID=UPI0013E9FE97|nr:thioredoxin family protein [Brevibacillus sp. SYP-B805]NGQ96264.1 thioredoxin family protein [Brevibacillus sp. SYP-B805]